MRSYPITKMEIPELGECSFELAGDASLEMANPRLWKEGGREALRLMAGFSWSERAMRKVAANKLFCIMLRYVRNPSKVGRRFDKVPRKKRVKNTLTKIKKRMAVSAAGPFPQAEQSGR